MSALEDISIPLEPDNFYHIFNQGNNSENLFYSIENYKYFLKKLNEYMGNYFQFYAYCLLPNHFHLLVKICSIKEILDQFVIDFPKGFGEYKNLKPSEMLKINDLDFLSSVVSERFRRFFLSYAKSINKQLGRSGSLFRKKFRRKKLNSDDYFRGLVWYIHNTPVKHNIYNNYKSYPWSSYSRILMERDSNLEKLELLKWFENKENFIHFHEEKKIDWDRLNHLIIED